MARGKMFSDLDKWKIEGQRAITIQETEEFFQRPRLLAKVMCRLGPSNCRPFASPFPNFYVWNSRSRRPARSVSSRTVEHTRCRFRVTGGRAATCARERAATCGRKARSGRGSEGERVSAVYGAGRTCKGAEYSGGGRGSPGRAAAGGPARSGSAAPQASCVSSPRLVSHGLPLQRCCRSNCPLPSLPAHVPIPPPQRCISAPNF